MKKLYFAALAAMMMFMGCSESYDDSAIWDKFDEMEKEHSEMQAQIDAQQTLLNALANNLTIVSVTPIAEGFLFTFSDGSTITVKHGEKGEQGEQGEQGEKGEKGDTGAQGEKGEKGDTGAQGEKGEKGDTGAQGEKGEDGDSLFSSVTIGESEVTFVLTDGTIITIPLSGNETEEEPTNNKIFYTTIDGKKLFPTNTDPSLFGAMLVSNTYKDGQGVLVFDDTVTLIGESAFYNCYKLTSITIPDSVSSIAKLAFYGCSNLTSLIIPDGVTSIRESAFEGCSCLETIDIPTSVLWFDDAAFRYCSSLKEITIPSSETSIDTETFNGCRSLTSITIPDNVSSIGKMAFYNCSSIESITFGNGITSIGTDVFSDCWALKDVHISDIAGWCGVTFADYDSNPLYVALNLYLGGELVVDLVIPDGVTSIGNYAFYSCDSIESVDIPDSVTSIGTMAFYNCSSLIEIVCDAITPPTLGSDVFKNTSNDIRIYVPYNSLGSYRSATDWQSLYSHITSLDAPYEVGDLVTYENVVGVVYSISETTIKLVSVEEGETTWGLYNKEIGTYDEDNGLNNMQIAQNSEYYNYLSAFIWCDSYADGWYLPASNELYEIQRSRETVNITLSANGYSIIDGVYWSSTETNSAYACAVDFAKDKIDLYGLTTKSYKVRAIKTINYNDLP